MCEPSHSICQYPEEPLDGGGGASYGTSTNESRLRIGLDKIGSWLKKVRGWFHLSKLGSGHSESEDWALTKQLWLPCEPIKYEVGWWDRSIKFDGWYNVLDRHGLKEEALDCATSYAHQVSIGSLSQLRNFLEISLRRSNRPHRYVERVMEDLLNPEGRDWLRTQLRRHRLYFNNYDQETSNEVGLNSLIKLVVGCTRKRGWLTSAWADDSKLWLALGS